MNLRNLLDASLRKRSVRNHAFRAEAPTDHHVVVDFLPAPCPFFDGVFSSHANHASRAPATTGCYMLIEGNEMKVRILSIVPSSVVYGKDVRGLSLRQLVGEPFGQNRPLFLGRFGWQSYNEAFAHPTFAFLRLLLYGCGKCRH